MCERFIWRSLNFTSSFFSDSQWPKTAKPTTFANEFNQHFLFVFFLRSLILLSRIGRKMTEMFAADQLFFGHFCRTHVSVRWAAKEFVVNYCDEIDLSNFESIWNMNMHTWTVEGGRRNPEKPQVWNSTFVKWELNFRLSDWARAQVSKTKLLRYISAQHRQEKRDTRKRVEHTLKCVYFFFNFFRWLALR